jgi:hypothetical protein
MVVTQYSAAPGQGVLVERAGLLILAQLAQVGREPAGRVEGVGVVLAQHAAEAGEGVVLELAGLLELVQGCQGEAEEARPARLAAARATQPGHRGRQLAGRVSAPAVQPDEEVLPGRLRRGDPDQHLTAGVPAAALLDRPERRVQPAGHIQPLDQLGHRHHPRCRRQRRIRRADPHPPPALAAP